MNTRFQTPNKPSRFAALLLAGLWFTIASFIPLLAYACFSPLLEIDFSLWMYWFSLLFGISGALVGHKIIYRRRQTQTSAFLLGATAMVLPFNLMLIDIPVRNSELYLSRSEIFFDIIWYVVFGNLTLGWFFVALGAGSGWLLLRLAHGNEWRENKVTVLNLN